MDTRRGMIHLVLLPALFCIVLILCKPIIAWLPSANVPCLVHMLGYNCPFCGGTRCVTALLNFDIKTAFYYNPLVVIFAVLFMFYYIFCVVSCFKKKYTPPRLNLSNTAVYILLGLIIAFGIVRNMPFYKDILY